VAQSVTHCPACGTRAAAIVGRRATGFAFIAGGRTFEHPAYSIHACATCDLHFKSDRIADAELSDYYARLEFESFESGSLMPPDRLIVEEAKALPAGRRVLDFGCGVGRSLALSIGRHECFGVEPNERAAQIARGRGITIITEGQLQAGAVGLFDMIVMSDVYEHMTRPLEEVKRLSRSLGNDGRLVIVTGSADAALPRELLSQFWYFRAPGHLHMATRRHMEWLAREASLSLGRVQSISHYDANFIRSALQRFKLWAYTRTHLEPESALGTAVGALPIIGRAACWENAPAVTGGSDHVFAVLTRTESPIR
jgi:SAM-dependent methyltransferase